jgi:hypothetical protein
MIIDFDIIAYSIIIARDDIFELHASRDAAELATFLINNSDHSAIIDELHPIMTAMILDPID